MELWALQQIAQGTASLAELERVHPILGKDLRTFVEKINRCCREAYKRFSACLDDVLALGNEPTEAKKAEVFEKLREASNSKWFSDVAHICDDLAGVANTYDSQIRRHIEEDAGEARDSLLILLSILHAHEGDLKQDIRRAVDLLKVDISQSRIDAARERVLTLKDEIDRNLTRINGVALQITGSAADGAHAILTREQIAEAALRRPERVLLLNMALVVILLIVGATILQFVSLLMFPILTSFVLAAVIVLNAFYLKSIDKLSDESFLELLRLALLKFFAPLQRRQTTR